MNCRGATGLRNADAVAYSTCEIHNKAKYDRIRPKTVSESLDLVAIGSEKPQIVDYMPGEALRFAVYDGPKAENVELLGSCVFECTRFWPAGFEGTLQLTEEQTRREKKYNVILKIKVATPESALPHQFAAAAKEQSTNGNGGFERFEAEMLKLRERMPFLTEADAWTAWKPLDWAQFLQRHRGPSWDAKQERIHLTFSLYDLDGDGMLSLADAISLSTEVVRLEKIYGEESAAIPVCEEMRWLYGFIANAAETRLHSRN
eukprot:g3374.t1